MLHITVYNDQTGVTESHALTAEFLHGLPKTEKAGLTENEKLHKAALAEKSAAKDEEKAAE